MNTIIRLVLSLSHTFYVNLSNCSHFKRMYNSRECLGIREPESSNRLSLQSAIRTTTNVSWEQQEHPANIAIAWRESRISNRVWMNEWMNADCSCVWVVVCALTEEKSPEEPITLSSVCTVPNKTSTRQNTKEAKYYCRRSLFLLLALLPSTVSTVLSVGFCRLCFQIGLRFDVYIQGLPFFLSFHRNYLLAYSIYHALWRCNESTLNTSGKITMVQ